MSVFFQTDAKFLSQYFLGDILKALEFLVILLSSLKKIKTDKILNSSGQSKLIVKMIKAGMT